MGLIVCKAIVEKMGPSDMNKIFVESTYKKGTKFYFFLKFTSKKKLSIELSRKSKTSTKLLFFFFF